jgi:hypothetical protein
MATASNKNDYSSDMIDDDPKASLNGEFHRPGFQYVKLWYEIDVFLNA